MIALAGPLEGGGRREVASPLEDIVGTDVLAPEQCYVSPAQSRISSFRSKLRSKVGGPSWFYIFYGTTPRSQYCRYLISHVPPLRIGEVDLHRHDLSNNPSLSLARAHSLITTRSCLIPPVSWTSS